MSPLPALLFSHLFTVAQHYLSLCENFSLSTGHCDRQLPKFHLSQQLFTCRNNLRHFLPIATTSTYCHSLILCNVIISNSDNNLLYSFPNVLIYSAFVRHKNSIFRKISSTIFDFFFQLIHLKEVHIFVFFFFFCLLFFFYLFFVVIIIINIC